MKEMIIQFICIFIAISIATVYLNSQKVNPKEVEIKRIENVIIKINDESNNLILNNNNSVKELLKQLPIEGIMDNKDNELSLELEEKIISKPIKIEKVSKGDVMLSENNKIIIFKKDKITNKEYTKLGKLLLVDKLDEINKDKINVMISKG